MTYKHCASVVTVLAGIGLLSLLFSLPDNATSQTISPPLPPSNVTTTPVSQNSVRIDWQDGSDDETGFKIEGSFTGANGSFFQLTTVASTTTTWLNNGLQPGQTYYWRIRAYNTAGDSEYSNTASGTTLPGSQPPPAPAPSIPAVMVTASDASAAEPSNHGAFRINRTGTATTTLTVNYTITGTAVNGSDYATIPASAAIPAGATSATINLSVINDTEVEQAETAVLTLDTSPAYTFLASTSIATVNITSEDVAPSPGAVPVISGFAANPTGIYSGAAATLNWMVSNASSLSINQGVGTVTGSSVQVSPTTTKTYTLTATNSSGSATRSASVQVTFPLTPKTPLNDLGSATYKGFSGGLYENSLNTMPLDHHAAGLSQQALIQPLNGEGNPDPNGKIVLLSVGVSNTTQEFADGQPGPGNKCTNLTFTGQATAHSAVNHSTLAIVNGAASQQFANLWDQPTDANYDRILTTKLAPQNLSEKQVQIAWVKTTNNLGPTSVLLPAANADAYAFEQSLGNIVRTLKTRYPNLKQVFISTRTYAGYVTSLYSSEPYTYENGFSAKWLIQAQVDQMRNGGTVTDSRAGNLNYNTVAPWIAWGPYLWADGTTPRSDGLTWQRSDFVTDGIHPSCTGVEKVGDRLMQFFLNSPHTEWFTAL